MIKPSGPLMVEHRLIEKMVGLLKKEVVKIKDSNSLDIGFIDSVVDFFRFYADKTHHGKEEDILFRVLAKKLMSEDLKNMMDGLINDHKIARAKVAALVECRDRFSAFDKTALKDAVDVLNFLIGLYPAHIQKEDIVFFPKVIKLLSEEDQDAMTKEFYEFDRSMIHVKYMFVVESLSK